MLYDIWLEIVGTIWNSAESSSFSCAQVKVFMRSVYERKVVRSAVSRGLWSQRNERLGTRLPGYGHHVRPENRPKCKWIGRAWPRTNEPHGLGRVIAWFFDNGTYEGAACCYVISNMNNNRGQIKIKPISSPHVYSGFDLAFVSTTDTRGPR
jgi:hypothetical protein